ncbi:MAG TPA: hypothetical protein VH309_01205 [Elusimicrobiota bacterium]|jgi:hypothetical protein|nr:hypothetical protein [Elusimicrobiota bacterium]
MRVPALCFALLCACAAGARAAAEAADLASLSPRAKRELCLREITPESMIAHQFGAQTRQGLYDYATCTELVSGKPSLCGFFPGGPRVQAPLSPALRLYTEVGGDRKIHRVFEYDVCDSRSAGYLLLAGLVSGKPRETLLPYARRMLNGEKSTKPEELLEVSSEVYHSRALAAGALPKLVRAGFFNYLLGRRACAGVRLARLRRECEWKGAAVDALRAGRPELCAARDLMCRALFAGESVCRETGRDAVRLFCDDEFPALKPSAEDWRRMRSVL